VTLVRGGAKLIGTNSEHHGADEEGVHSGIAAP
jgi:hypothetical protein